MYLGWIDILQNFQRPIEYMAFLNGLGLFMAMRHPAPGTPIMSERRTGIKETHYGVCFQDGKISHLGKKLLLLGLFVAV
ncbi:hypothetical protein I79_006218 [Cricetulus griseus]|uniref:Uncharacterized protein n=1 Tax=Cricetulus griseus TaxID=10029 RepID=G3H789_CRIGR|nr:hypothetical protein I79_006218 [Cricetulus griseus]